MPYFDHRTNCGGSGHDWVGLATAYIQFRAGFFAGHARTQHEMTDLCDRSQSLPAKAERMYIEQIIGRLQLAGRMAGNRQWQFIRGNATTVVR